MVNQLPITVVIRPTPSFSIGNLEANGTTLNLISTSFFPEELPRQEYALYARVLLTGAEKVLPQPSPFDPLVTGIFPLTLETDGVYQLRLIAFPMEQEPDYFGKALGTVVYDNRQGKLVELVEKNEELLFVPIAVDSIALSRIPYYSAAKYFLQTKPGENSRDERLATLLNYHMEGRKALYKNKIAELDKEIRDFDLAIRGAQNEFKLGRYVEAQRILTLLDKLRSDTCFC